MKLVCFIITFRIYLLALLYVFCILAAATPAVPIHSSNSATPVYPSLPTASSANQVEDDFDDEWTEDDDEGLVSCLLFSIKVVGELCFTYSRINNTRFFLLFN